MIFVVKGEEFQPAKTKVSRLCCKRKDVFTRQVLYLWRNIEVLSYNCCCSGKAICITYSEWVFVDLGNQDAFRVRYILICGLPGSALVFHIISLTAWFLEKKLLNIKCVFWVYLQRLSERFVILRRIVREMIKNVYSLHVKYLLSFRKILQY